MRALLSSFSSFVVSLPRLLASLHGAPPAPGEVAEALRASDARYRGIVETQQATVLRLDFEGRILFANEFCCAFVGVTRAEVIGRSYVDWVHPDDRADLATRLVELMAPPYRARGLNRVIVADGSTRWLEWEGTTILDEQGRPAELQSIGRDVTERLAGEAALQASLAELRASEEKLRLLAQRQVTIREDERKRLGFDLHDGVCQELVGIGILVEALRRRLGPTSVEVAGELTRVVRHLNHLGEHVRLLAGELRPMLLHDLGLEGSLRSLAAGLTNDAVQVRAVFPACVPRLAEVAEVAVYRIAQEAIANAVRHAEAREVTVELDVRDARVRLEVRDAGRGFDAATRRRDALGILGMEERALALGGTLEVLSTPGHGTVVRLVCPLVARAAA